MTDKTEYARTWIKPYSGSELDGFKLVYQGGHHEVYCNGTVHKATQGGGYARVEPVYAVGSEFCCDCANWRN
ncbi:MAG TPA: hypothetical protein VEY92_08410 [Pseudoxanthomonas sp.]|nr:hypothetical protein [Pseudoxanthomonas sp.]